MLGWVAIASGCTARDRQDVSSQRPTTPERLSTSQRRPTTPLAQVPIGSYSEYAQESAEQHSVLTVALVSREQGTVRIESTMKGMAGSESAEVTTRQTFAPGQDLNDRPQSSVFQVSAFPPMEQGPAAAALMQDGPFMKTDGTGWQADGTVSTPAGTFRASHFLQRRSDGTTVDFWLSRDALPVGLVKLRAVSPNQLESKVELVHTGVGALPKVTATPVPFDREVMRRQLFAAVADRRER